MTLRSAPQPSATLRRLIALAATGLGLWAAPALARQAAADLSALEQAGIIIAPAPADPPAEAPAPAPPAPAPAPQPVAPPPTVTAPYYTPPGYIPPLLRAQSAPAETAPAETAPVQTALVETAPPAAAPPAAEPASVVLPTPVPPAPTPVQPTPVQPTPVQPTFVQPTLAPPVPAPLASRRPALTAPVTVDDFSQAPDGPPSVSDQLYQDRVRASFNAAQGMQGVLDGRWVLRGGDGRDLFALQIADRGGGQSIEGAWRDLRAGPALNASGFLDSVSYEGADLVVRFIDRRAGETAAEARLRPLGDGGWSGTLTRGRDQQSAVMNRR